MATIHTLRTPASLPVALLSQAIHRLSRHELEDLAQSLIDHLDAQDGDPDLEDDDPAGVSRYTPAAIPRTLASSWTMSGFLCRSTASTRGASR